MPKVNVKDQRRKQLVDAAISAIARRGVMDVTITDVAEIAGMSRGIINFYFVSKDALIEQSFRALLAGFEASWRRELEKSEGQEPRERLSGFIRAQFQGDICNQKRMSVWLACFGLAAANKTYRQYARSYADKFEEAAQPLFDAAHSDMSAMGLLVMVQGAWQQLAIDWSAEARDDAADELVSMIVNAPQAPARPKKPAQHPARDETLPQFDFGDLFTAEA